MISRLQPKPFAEEFEAIISSAEFSTMSSAQLREKTIEALERCGHVKGSDFDVDEEEPYFSQQPSWSAHPDRWMALRLIAEDYFSADETNSEEDKEEADEEAVEPSDGEDSAAEDESSVAERAIESIVGKFSKKKEIDDFLLGKLPRVPIIGWPFKILIFAFETIRTAWNWFLDFLAKVADRIDLKNNLVSALEYVAGLSRVTKFLVMVFATIISYLGFIIFIVVLPLLRVIADPIGRFFRTIRRRLRSEDDDSDDDTGVPT